MGAFGHAGFLPCLPLGRAKEGCCLQPASLMLPRSMHCMVTLVAGPFPADSDLSAALDHPVANSSRVSSHFPQQLPKAKRWTLSILAQNHPTLCCTTGGWATAPCQLSLAFPAPGLSPATFWFHGVRHVFATGFFTICI